MYVSAKTEYACIALLELSARFDAGEPVRIREIADRHGIPSRFLVQILLQLKGAGLVGSTRGSSGGYRLLRDPAEISLGEVMSVIEGPPTPMTTNATRLTPTSRALLGAWQEVADIQNEALANISFAELCERARGRVENMYYI